MINRCQDKKCSHYGEQLVNTKEHGHVCPGSVKQLNLTVLGDKQ